MHVEFRFYYVPDLILTAPAVSRYPSHLILGGGRRNVRVEPAAGDSNKLRRNRFSQHFRMSFFNLCRSHSRKL